MSIISIKDNRRNRNRKYMKYEIENNRWNRNAKKNNNSNNSNNKKQTNKQTKKTKKENNKGGTEAIVEGWELNDFVVHLKSFQLFNIGDVFVDRAFFFEQDRAIFRSLNNYSRCRKQKEKPKVMLDIMLWKFATFQFATSKVVHDI